MSVAWYVIECLEVKDAFLRLKLAAAGFHVWRPVREVEVTVRWGGRKLRKRKTEKRYVPRFGRYLFIRVEMSDSVQSAICEVKGVRGWLCLAGATEPAPIADSLIEFYERNVAQPVENESQLHLGEMGPIKEGPFLDHCGVVTAIGKRGGGVLEIDLFGRPTPYIFEAGHVEPVEPRFQRPIGARRKSA